jgi:hypothetical protein
MSSNGGRKVGQRYDQITSMIQEGQTGKNGVADIFRRHPYFSRLERGHFNQGSTVPS